MGPQATARAVQRDSLLERDAELAALDEAVAAAADGVGAFVAIEGSAGIGKSSLLSTTRRRAAEHGLRVLGARGGELEHTFPFGVVRQLFEPALARAAPEEREAALSGAAALAGPLFGGAREGWATPASGDAAFSMLHGLYWLTANLAERGPLLLSVDDLHWTDASSLRFLDYLARRIEGVPVLVVATLRPLEADSDPALADLLADAATVMLRPAPLTAGAARELIAERVLGERADQLAGPIHEATGGNPLLLRELMIALRDTDASIDDVRHIAPEVVSRRVRLQLAKLGADATALARAVAVLGDDADVHEAAALARLDATSADQAAQLLARAEILDAGHPLRFVHPLLRSALYDAIPPGERENAHARAAAVLQERDAPVERVAAQLVVAPSGACREVVELLRAAARRALEDGAAESAHAYLERALAEPPAMDDRADVLLELADTASLLGTPDAPGRFAEALALVDDPERRARTRLDLARSLFWRSQEQQALDEIDTALAETDASPALRRQLQAEYYSAALRMPATHQQAFSDLEALRLDDEDDEPARMLQALQAYALSATGERLEEAVGLAERALARGIPSDRTPGWSYWGAVSALSMADRFDTPLRVVEAALADARRRGAVYLFCGASVVRASLLHARGALVEAEADARAAVEAVPHRAAMIMPVAFGELAQLLVLRGYYDEAAALVSQAGADGVLPEGFALMPLLRARGMLRLARRDTAGAVADAEAAGRAASSVGFRNPVTAPWRTEQALALLASGQPELARKLAAAELEAARRWGAPRGVGRALRVLGLAQGGKRGIVHLEESVRLLADSPALLERALSLVEWSAARRRAGHRADARSSLREGLELARRCGARPLADRAHEELIAAGAKPRSTALSGVESLTPSERRVAAMAAEGMSNPQIAQALFVTLRTVEMHLSNAFRKLDIGSRTQLPDALAQAPSAG